MPVVDASVVVKWFVEEPGSANAHVLLEAQAAGHVTLVAPHLLIYEVSNVLLRNPTFSTSTMQRCIHRLYELELDLLAPPLEVVIQAIALAGEKRLTFYDALYMQLARHLELPRYTADRKLVARLSNASFIKVI